MGLQNPTMTNAMNAAVVGANADLCGQGSRQPVTEETVLNASMDGLLPWCEKGISWMIGEGTDEPNSPQR